MWESPLNHFLEVLKVLGDFTPHQVLYRGEILLSNNLPWHYLPTNIGFRFTEPIPFLAIIGVAFFILRHRKKEQRIVGILILMWFLIPASIIVITQTALYGGIRQVLFIMPPIFIFIGFVFQEVDIRLTNTLIKHGMALMVVLPGIWGILNLHPYEYTYFNKFGGGTSGAYGVYDLDYWCTSYREAAEFLNENAPHGSVVVVAGPEYGVRNFIRNDIRVIPDWQRTELPGYEIRCEDVSLSSFSSVYPARTTIHRGSAVFTTIFAASQ
jgi:4-amino-4-deoxy-L-arabinose transferase-like glycosyltransferase